VGDPPLSTPTAHRSRRRRGAKKRRGNPEASHQYADATVKTRRSPVGLQDAEEL
jgi:hypothetical protein